jgi:RHS repeat-associated protein
LGSRTYELTNHLGNVLATISDKKIGHDSSGVVNYFTAEVLSQNDYYPFGMAMPGRKYFVQVPYRYGFNGKENDNEIKGEGNQLDYGARIYDPRLGKFLSVDPLEQEYPELTPYQFASNRPIDGIDVDGTEFSKAKLLEILGQAKAKLGPLATESAIVLRVSFNAATNANTFGISDNLPGFLSTNNLDDYDNDYDKSLYLYGRILGDVAAGLQGGAEIGAGGATAAAGGGMSASGVGAVAGLPTAVVGGVVVGHGAAVGAAAATDIGWALKKLEGLSDGVDNSKNENTPEQAINNQVQSAHQKNPSASNTVKAKDLPLLHSEENIVKSADYQKIKKLSDEELIKSVTNPTNYKKVTINTKTGKLVDGNTRIYEIKRRGLDVDVPVDRYTPNDSAFPDLKEPVKK